MARIATEVVDDTIVFIFQASSILDEVAVKEVSSELNSYLDATTEEFVVLDLSRVTMMTSAIIGELVKFRKRCEQDKVELALCGLSKNIAEVFKITRMDKIFKIYKDRAKAIKSFKRKGLSR